MKKFEVLDGLPPYGPMYISVTNNEIPDYSEGFVVRLFKSDGTSWVGNFKRGWTSFKAVYELQNVASVLIIAYGTAYLVDPNNIQPVDVFGVDYSAAVTTKNHQIVLEGLTWLTIVEPTGAFRNSKGISLDGLSNLAIQDNIVSGLAYLPGKMHNDWVEYTYDIETDTVQYSYSSRHKWT